MSSSSSVSSCVEFNLCLPSLLFFHIWFFRFWSNYVCVEDLLKLNDYMDVKSLLLSDVVTEHDRSVGGRFAM
jgi:hypothetical protein